MILAAADCAEGKGPPPPELQMAWQARQWSTLPETGGLRDQQAGELYRMATAENVYEAVRAWRRSTNWAQWAKENPDEWEIVCMVRRLRAAHG